MCAHVYGVHLPVYAQKLEVDTGFSGSFLLPPQRQSMSLSLELAISFFLLYITQSPEYSELFYSIFQICLLSIEPVVASFKPQNLLA